MTHERVALAAREPHHVLIEDVAPLGAYRRTFQELRQVLLLDQRIVALGRRLAGFRPGVQVRQLDP